MDDAPRFVAIDQEAEFRAFLERVPELPQHLRAALEAVPVFTRRFDCVSPV